MFDDEDASTEPGETGDSPLWGGADQHDPFFDDAFSQEIANIDESDWAVDADELWGDPGGADLHDAPPGGDVIG